METECWEWLLAALEMEEIWKMPLWKKPEHLKLASDFGVLTRQMTSHAPTPRLFLINLEKLTQN